MADPDLLVCAFVGRSWSGADPVDRWGANRDPAVYRCRALGRVSRGSGVAEALEWGRDAVTVRRPPPTTLVMIMPIPWMSVPVL